MTTLLRKTFFLAALVYAQFATAQTPADALEAVQLEDWDRAITIYSKLAQDKPTDQQTLLSLGNVYVAKGDNAKAKDTYRKAFDANPEGAYALIANGRILMLDGKPAEANTQFDKAARAGKKDVNALRMIGESFLFYIAPGERKPDLVRAAEKLKAAVDYKASDFNSLMSLGYAYKSAGNGGLAAQNYEFAEALEPSNPLPALMLAKVYRIGKLYDKAMTFVDKAIAINPKYTPALRFKAETLYINRKWEAARDAYRTLVNSGNGVTIEDEMTLANTLFITKDYKGTSELVEKIIAKDGSKNYLRRLLAYTSYETGDYARGLTVMNDYFTKVSADKVLATDYLYYGRLQIKGKGDTTQAINNLRKSIDIDSSTWAIHKEIAEIQYGRKDYCGAVVSYQRYLDSLPTTESNYLTDLYKSGLAQYYCKDDSMRFVKAEKIFAKVAELRPTAGIGWLWAGKSAKNGDPTPAQIEADPEMAHQYGKAMPYWEKYIDLPTLDKEKNKKDILEVCQYLAYCYFVRVDAEKFNKVVAKWEELETDAAQIETIKGMKDSFGKDHATNPTGLPANGGKNK